MRSIAPTIVLLFLIAIMDAQAAPILILSSSGTDLIVGDNQLAGVVLADGSSSTHADLNPAVGIVSPGLVTLGDFTIDPSTTATSTTPLGGPNEARMDLLLNTFSSGPGTLTASLTDTGFTVFDPDRPVGNFGIAIGGFTTDTDTALDLFSGSFDANNGFFGSTDTIAISNLGPDNFDSSTSTSVTPQTDPFSITLDFEITHTGASTTAFNADASFTASVPEPTAILTWGCVGGVSIGVHLLLSWRRRRVRS